MADYFTILSKTIAGLPSNTAESRAFVYAKARQAIENRLKAINPPPGKEAIAKQMQVLEEAVHRIEADQVLQELMTPPEIEPAPPPPAPKTKAQPQVEPQPRVQPQPRAQPEPNGGMRKAGAVSAQQQSPEPPPVREAPMPRAGPPAYDSSLDSIDTLDRAGKRPGKVSRETTSRRRSGGWLGAALSFLMLALLGAGAYGLWLNKEPLMEALGIDRGFGFGGQQQEIAKESQAPQQSAQEEDQEPAEEQAGQEQAQQEQAGQEQSAPDQQTPAVREAGEESQNGKEDVRLDESGNSVAGQPSAEEEQQQAEAPEQQAEGQVQAQSGEVDPVDDGQQGAAGQAAGGQAAGSAEQGAAPAIGQKAFLYEEGSAGAGATRDNAAVVWSLVQEPPAEGLPPEAVIRGQLDVPGRGLTMQLSIKRNSDEALPASHVIELVFNVPADFAGGNIDNVARFVMKANEQARGEGLVAVPARIDAGYFLIALNNLPQAVETNRKLLIESSWIDVPLGYTSGRRALVALEKGAIGDKVFRDAFADWDKR